MKAQYLAIALLSSVVMPITPNAATVILSFEEIPDGHAAIQIPNQGPISYFVPVDVSGPTFSGALAEFELQVTKDASGLFDGTVTLLGQTSNSGFFNGINFGGNFNGITYLSGSFSGASLSGPETNIELPLLNVNETFTIPEQTGNFYTSSVGNIEEFLGDGTQTAFDIELSPSVDGSITVATPEPSTWAMMLMGFAGVAYAGWKRRRTNRLATI
jgi:hypothetical protein